MFETRAVRPTARSYCLSCSYWVYWGHVDLDYLKEAHTFCCCIWWLIIVKYLKMWEQILHFMKITTRIIAICSSVEKALKHLPPSWCKDKLLYMPEYWAIVLASRNYTLLVSVCCITAQNILPWLLNTWNRPGTEWHREVTWISPTCLLFFNLLSVIKIKKIW